MMIPWSQTRKKIPAAIDHGRKPWIFLDVEAEPEDEQAPDEKQQGAGDVALPGQPVEQPGVEGDDEPDEHGRDQVGVRPPARGDDDQAASLTALMT